MKKISYKWRGLLSLSILTSSALLSVFLMSNKAGGFIINGNIQAPDGTIIKIAYEYMGTKTIDSAAINNNKMMLKGNLPETVVCTLSNSINQQQKIIVLQNENVKVTGSISKFYYAEVKGAAENELFSAFKEKNININADYRRQLEKSNVDFHDRNSNVYLEFHRRVDSLTLSFVKANPNTVASSLAIINSHLNSTDFAKAEKCYGFLTQNAKKGYYAKRIKSFVDASKAVEVGKQASNVVLKDIAGNKFDLSQYRGKYVLLDFWASWCVPCREEHPLLRKLNAELKGKNLVFVSISMDSDQKSWRKAVADDGLTWIQLNDPLALKGSVAEAYALKALPFNCILDPQGKIIGTKLRGEALTSFLENLYLKTE
ncbi:TlpA disulfide reductase family protein [Pedobacter sp. Leaf176]|uniref:TlpA disulfide reductase family protein n=1 Tax=Pedobacter sp. Leaf176 TaxID=1736286 RepID=UPI0009EB6CC5|nr:TlpA disulfide reductase family protein [Pedobacter sp. Leaf176]